jgi:hypothetical protein
MPNLYQLFYHLLIEEIEFRPVERDGHDLVGLVECQRFITTHHDLRGFG